MVNDVEAILNQIREQVRAEADKSAAKLGPGSEQRNGTSTIAAGDSGNVETLARISAHLTTTSRAWDRLPPIFSNRSGAGARLELWLKQRLRSLSRWFTWEQINYNAAVHHALTDTVAVLTSQERQLADARQQQEQHRARLEEIYRDLQRQLEQLQARIETHATDLRQLSASVSGSIAAHGAALEEQAQAATAAHQQVTLWISNQARDSAAGLQRLASDINIRLGELSADLRDEQRVCFKQLSLETSEAAVGQEQARRAIEKRLSHLEKAN